MFWAVAWNRPFSQGCLRITFKGHIDKNAVCSEINLTRFEDYSSKSCFLYPWSLYLWNQINIFPSPSTFYRPGYLTLMRVQPYENER